MVISAYHFIRNSNVGFSGTLADFAEPYLNDTGYRTNVFDHIHGFLQLRSLDNILFNVYEEFVADPLQGIKRICQFLECCHSGEQLTQLTENVSFKKMRELITLPSAMVPTDGISVPDPDYK